MDVEPSGPGAEHDPKETAVAFAGVALIAESLECPVIKMDIKTERLPDGSYCTSGVYATGGAPLYDEEQAPPHERELLRDLNNAIRARVTARLGLAGDIANAIYTGEDGPEPVLAWDSEPLRKARQELTRYVDDPDDYLRTEARLTWEQLRRHWKAVDALADALLKHESLNGNQLRKLLRDRLEREKKPRVRPHRARAGRPGAEPRPADRPDSTPYSSAPH